MDPISLTILTVTGAVEVGLALAHLIKRRKKKAEPAPQAQAPEESQPQESAPHQEPPKYTDQEIIQEVLSHIAFSSRFVQVGIRNIGTREIGKSIREVPYPAHHLEIRPIRHPGEIDRRLPAERTSPGALQVIRLISGGALVQSHLEEEPILEPITEPILKEFKRLVYVILDNSGSMFGEMGDGIKRSNWWMIPIWKGIVLSLLRRTRQQEATFILRIFSDQVSEPYIVQSAEEEQVVADLVRNLGQGGGTNFAPPLAAALIDFQKERYDQADVMIVTDGGVIKEYPLLPQTVRQAYQTYGVRLHAIVLGTQNQHLRDCADVYQEIPEAGVILPPVRRP